jgi:hypothetical protein
MIAEVCSNASRIIKNCISPFVVTSTSKIAFEKKMVTVEKIA